MLFLFSRVMGYFSGIDDFIIWRIGRINVHDYITTLFMLHYSPVFHGTSHKKQSRIGKKNESIQYPKETTAINIKSVPFRTNFIFDKSLERFQHQIVVTYHE